MRQRTIPILAALIALAAAPAARADCGNGTQVLPYCEVSLTYIGCCAGQTLTWCQDGVTCTMDCSGNPYCGWRDSDGFYNCGTIGGADPSGTHDLACPEDEDGDGISFPYDCDDGNPAIHPGAFEVCDGILDNNCDGVQDAFELDDDGDGWSECDQDCNDVEPDIYPGAPDDCGDGVDSDCGGDFAWEFDGDGDGFAPCAGDCDDERPGVNPDADEVCEDGLDNDCDGEVDGYDPECLPGVGDDDDDDVGGPPLKPRTGPWGLRCDAAHGRVPAGLLAVLALAAAAWLRRR